MDTRISSSGFRILSLGSLDLFTAIATTVCPPMRRRLTPSWEQHILNDRTSPSSGNQNLPYQLNPTDDTR